jgi:hypothetical protein
MIRFTVIQDDNKAGRCSKVQWCVMNFLVDEEIFIVKTHWELPAALK